MSLGAQTTHTLGYNRADSETETGIRMKAGLDLTLIPKTSHLGFEEEVRIEDNFSRFKKSYSTVSLDYKLTPWLKTAASYSFIYGQTAADATRIRHRIAWDLTGSYKYGRLKFSLRERLQLTNKAYDINTWQEPRNDLKLKSRVKVAFDIRHSAWEPFIALELRNTFNGVNPEYFAYTTTWNGETHSIGRWYNPEPKYNDVYIDRLRITAGTTFKVRNNHEFGINAIIDCNYNLDIDTNAEGYQKADKSGTGYGNDYPMLTLQNTYFIGLGLSYKFNLK